MNLFYYRERDIPVVREAWLTDSIEKQEPQPLEAYDLVSDLSVAGKGIPWDKQDPGEEAIESLSAEVHDLLFVTAFFHYFIEFLFYV